MEIDGEDYSFLANFLSAEMMADFFDFPHQRASETAASSNVEGVANMPTASASASEASPSSTVSVKSNDEIQRLINKNTNCNTAKSTKNWVSKYSKWAADNHVHTDLAEIPEDELDKSFILK